MGASSLPLLLRRRRSSRLLHDVSLRPLHKRKHPISRLAHFHRRFPERHPHIAVVRFCWPHSHLGLPDEPSFVRLTSIHRCARLGASVTLPNAPQRRLTRMKGVKSLGVFLEGFYRVGLRGCWRGGA